METVQAEAQEQRKETGIEERKTREEWKKKNRRMRWEQEKYDRSAGKRGSWYDKEVW